MKAVQENPEQFFATAYAMLVAEGMVEAASVLRLATARVEETGYDNWNGGTTIWTIFLLVEPRIFAELGSKREVLEEQIEKRLKPIVDQVSSDWYSIKIAPKIKLEAEWRLSKDDVSLATRKNILDGMQLDNVKWNGRLEEVEFLQRLYDLQFLPSEDSRFKDAASDIWQHRVNNPDDWPDNWIFDDKRFGLLHGNSETFLRFLCETIHPVVRPDRNQVLELVRHFNEQLQKDGWHLVEIEKIAGRPRFTFEKIILNPNRSVSRAKSVADALDAGWMQKEIERLENAVERDPALAIGTAKELIESCCKSILTKRDVTFSKSADLPELTKLLTKTLKLVPEGISEQAKGVETIRLILRNLSALTQYLAELRSLYGSGHGRDGNHRGLETRHARLAVGAAVAFIDFVTATYQQRSCNEDTNIPK